jgi:phospholipase/lecithinase/hemolysin
LQTKVKDFLEENSGATGVIFDVASVFTQVLDDPTKFGFKDEWDHGEEDCVWNDVLHPTSKMHQVIANEFVKVLECNPL